MNNTSALLGPLTNNAGPTLTMALLPGSPGIDNGDTTAAPAADQRGFPRPAGAAADIGAYEFGSVMPTLSISQDAGAGFTLIGSGDPGKICRLLTSTDLWHWVAVAINQFNSDGTAVFHEDASAAPSRFYQLTIP